tara:strand:+ start:751 stop:1092 length:342 start_codon:yes stop_codon:yes gene_type:complete
MNQKKPSWLKPIDKSKIEVIEAKESPWKQDPKGYFLIKINEKKISAGYCTNDNKLKYEFVGKNAKGIYETIAKMNLVSLFEHASYLGKELKKAELAIKYDLEYVQDEELNLKT